MGDKVGENPAALRAAVFFLLSSKNLRGGVQTPPPPLSRARVNTLRTIPRDAGETQNIICNAVPILAFNRPGKA